MQFKKTIAAGILLSGGWTGVAKADHAPPLDRPSPPPCCADGLCYPRPYTWGWYATRWRRWPTAPPPAAPDVTPPPALGPDVRPYEIPSPEEEDRRAPPPTIPPAPDVEGEAPPAGPAAAGPAAPGRPESPTEETPRTTPMTPRVPTTPPPPSFDMGEPQWGTEPRLPTTPMEDEPPPTVPFSEPGGAPPTTFPFGGEPTGSMDPPPAPPFGEPSRSGTVSGRTGESSTTSRPHRPIETPRPVRSSDPPPALPIALASWTN